MDDGARHAVRADRPGPTGLASRTLEAPTTARAAVPATPSTRCSTPTRSRVTVATSPRPRSSFAAASTRRTTSTALRSTIPSIAGRTWSSFRCSAGIWTLKREIGASATTASTTRARACSTTRRGWCEHEVPYKDVLHKVEIPTETWPAHDVRKCHVLRARGQIAPAPAEHVRERAAFFFDRCLPISLDSRRRISRVRSSFCASTAGAGLFPAVRTSRRVAPLAQLRLRESRTIRDSTQPPEVGPGLPPARDRPGTPATGRRAARGLARPASNFVKGRVSARTLLKRVVFGVAWTVTSPFIAAAWLERKTSGR